MTTGSSEPITVLLAAAGRGDAAARERLWATIYDELHRIAQSLLRNDVPGRRLQPTTLVHEAYLRLVGGEDMHWGDRRHFFGAAANAMRQIRIDDARKRKRLKRGGPGVGRREREQGIEGSRDQGTGATERSVPHPQRGWAPPAWKRAQDWDEPAVFDQDPDELLALNEALRKFEETDPRKVQLVNLRYFAELSVDECASAMDLSPRTVRNEWRIARAWLHRELTK